MIVWLWDAGNGRGVTDDGTRARRAAAQVMRAGQADAARVEMATLDSQGRALVFEYTRLGRGWTGRPRADGRIRWARLPGPVA